jgi:hypothetical protein
MTAAERREANRLRIWRLTVLHQCIRPLIGAFCVPCHHGYQRTCDLISGQASMGHSGHQCSQRIGQTRGIVRA